MNRRFGAAIVTAVVLHAALIGLTVRPRHSEVPRVLDASAAATTEVELFMLADDDGQSSVSHERASSPANPSDRDAQQEARATPVGARSQRSGSAPAAEAQLDQAGVDAALTELGTGTEPEGPSDGTSQSAEPARKRVNLGLDGSVMRQATLAARENGTRATQTPRRRPVFSLGHWSESVVRSIAQKSAPWEGRALLTLEWDAAGQLLSVTSSAASSNSDEWQRLAQGVSAQLATRPNVSAQGKRFRAVYLVKSELALPDGKGSMLPSAKYASAEQLRADNLPPASAINFGIKADGSAAKTRIVSVELVRSDAL